ncbi:MAG: GNAT family N-acetyltransferase [Prevotella sp.]|uniref:GNAT family N-acetyltransferase n=1 Tax=Prevotella sp. TaxID=59823 RepID=UPI002A35280A|nr:GNAT family N-acetyltransferase [Prevotella sp.]MDD7317972.1 GNAT family N-acetyltransferase [Prevotellaceae bacterium]MDY4020408.1 GNAT family N-acetyltransferase [Prevotella sp.]
MEETIIRGARKDEAPLIATMIMEAMNHDCCQNFAGPEHTLDDFHCMMTMLVGHERSQYSYLNTLVAECGGKVAGCLVCYDGALLRPLREQFIAAAREYLDRDFSHIDDETQAGELYLDSLCVLSAYRNRGIATALLRSSVAKAREMGIPAVGLLVDKGNPGAERLYTSLGFRHAGDTVWGGHGMKHLVFGPVDEE